MTEQELVERLRPSYVVDAVLLNISRALRAHGCEAEAVMLNEWIVANNARKSEAVSAIKRLVQERDEWEAACDSNTALGAELAETWKARASSAEAQLAEMREALERLASDATQIMSAHTGAHPSRSFQGAGMKMTETQFNVLDYVNRSHGFTPDGSLYWNGPRRSAANRLVKLGLLERTEYPRSSGYAITDAGRKALEQSQ